MRNEMDELFRLQDALIADPEVREMSRMVLESLERYLNDRLPQEKAEAWDAEGAQWDREANVVRFPESMETVLMDLAEMGIYGLSCPEEYGGGGLPYFTYIAAIERLSRRSPSLSVTISIHVTAMDVIHHFGSDDLKQRFLPRMASGEWLAGVAYSEPQSGSDMGGAQTIAVRDGDKCHLSGTKVFVTNGGRGQVLILLALTDPEKGKQGLSLFAFTRDDERGNRRPGFAITKLEDKMGIKSSVTSMIQLEDCSIPADDLIGTPGRGLAQALWGMDGGRIGIGAQALGLSEAAYNQALTYVKEREQFGRKLSEMQAIQFQLADIAARLATSRYAVYYAAWCKDHLERYTEEAAIAKKVASESAEVITNLSLELLGGYGYIREYGMDRWINDAKITKIYEGTNNIQNLVIARHELER